MGSDSLQGQEVFLSSKNIHTQPPVQWVPGSISMKVKQLGHEADFLPPLVLKLRISGTVQIPMDCYLVK